MQNTTMNDYKITFNQNSLDRNGRIYDPIIYTKMVNKFIQDSLPDEFKKMIIEIEEYDE